MTPEPVERCLCGRLSHEGDCGRVTDHIDFRLAYTCTPEPRKWVAELQQVDLLRGPRLPNAYDNGKTSGPGDWSYPDGVETVRDALRVCVGEAVHEVLEWFKVDGEMYLDPHGGYVRSIENDCNELVDRIIRAKSLEDAEESV